MPFDKKAPGQGHVVAGRTIGTGLTVPIPVSDDGLSIPTTGGGGGGGGTVDINHAVVLDYDTSGGTASQAALGIALPASGGPVGVSDSNPLPTKSGLGLILYDYMSLAQASTTDTYTFKTGGSGGSTVATVTVTWTDSTKTTVSSVART